MQHVKPVATPCGDLFQNLLLILVREYRQFYD